MEEAVDARRRCLADPTLTRLPDETALSRALRTGTTPFHGWGAAPSGALLGLPPDSRFANEKEAQFDTKRKWLTSPEGQAEIAKVRELSAYAEKRTPFLRSPLPQK